MIEWLISTDTNDYLRSAVCAAIGASPMLLATCTMHVLVLLR